MTRDELQQQAIELICTYKRVALMWATSVGKSFAAIGAARKTKSSRILLLVAEVEHKKNWEREFNKYASLRGWDMQRETSLTVECYASFKNYENTSWDMIILDEAHHITSEKRMGVLGTVEAKYFILLSATLSVQTIWDVSQTIGTIKTSKVTLEDAINWGIVSKPRIYLIPLALDGISPRETIVEEWGKKKERRVFRCSFAERGRYLMLKKDYPNVRLEISCTQLQKYNYLEQQITYWKQAYLRGRQEFQKNKWMQAGLKRKNMLGEGKTEEVKKLLRGLQNTRFICFCSSISQAEELGQNVIHSKKSGNKEVVEKFNEQMTDNIFAVKMLQEGQNLNGIEAGIIIQLDGEERSFIQRFGRSLRADDPVQYIFYYKGTRDEEYLQNALKGIDQQYVRQIKINQDGSIESK